MSRPKKPKTERELCLYRAQLSCKIGRDAIDGNARAPAGTTEMEYAMFNLLHAVEEIAKAMGEE